MSKVIFKKFLPAVMRNTRWGDLITVFQDIVNDLKTEQISTLRNKFDINLMTDDELFDTAAKFGFSLLSLDGYTSTSHFLRKEVSNIAARIPAKTTRTGYKYIFYNFNLNGEIFPIQLVANTVWTPIDTYWTDTSIMHVQDFFLDPSPSDTLDSTTGLWISTLDQTQLDYTLLRNFVLSYKSKYIETATEFISTNTQKVFYNDVLQMKRATEIPYFEHRLEIATNASGLITTKTYYDYAQTLSADMKSIMVKPTSSGLMTFNHIQIGNGSRTTLNSSISGVLNLVGTLKTGVSGTLGTLQYIAANQTNQIYVRKKYDNRCTFPTFSEISLHNASSGCLYYSTFPQVKWDAKQYSGVLFRITLV
jgi:hypothetical protein